MRKQIMIIIAYAIVITVVVMLVVNWIIFIVKDTRTEGLG